MSKEVSFNILPFPLMLLALAAQSQALGATSSSGSAAGSIDASPFQKTQERPKGKTVKPTLRASEHSPALKLDDESKLQSAIDSFTLIINRTPPGAVRKKMILGRAKTDLALVQTRMLKSKNVTGDPYNVKLIEQARQDVASLTADKDVPPDVLAQSYFLLGVSADDLNHVDEAVKNFVESLRLDPKSSDAGWMGFYLAEQQFEEKKYQQAIDTYRAYFKRWNPRTQRLVLYKMAWAYINLDKITDAENFFTALIRPLSHDDVERDSIRDLAYLTSKFRTETQTLALADRTFKSDADKMQFLHAVYDQQELQGMVAGQSLIFARMLQTETDPVERIKLKIRALASVQRQYASRPPFQEFVEIRKMIEKDSLKPESAKFASFGPSLDLETQRLIRAYVDTFSNKVQTPEPLDRETVGKSLRVLFESFDHYFPRSTLRSPVFSLWLDVCIDLKDWHCVDQVSLAIAQDTRLASLRPRAEIERLAALEELLKTDAHYRPALVEAAQQFVEHNPTSPRWLSVAKRLTDFRLEDKKYPQAIALLEQIYGKELTQESFYRLQWARFSDTRYQELLSDRRNASLKEKPDPRLAGIYRESALKLALKARADGDLAAYTSQIHTFFSLNTDPEKAAVARKDYLSFLLEKNELHTAEEVFTSLPATDRCSKKYSDLLADFCVRRMKTGAFAPTLSLLPPKACGASPELGYLRLLAAIGSGGRANPNDIAALPAEKREYLLSLLALTQPARVVSYFKLHEAETEGETSAKLISTRLKRGRWDDRIVRPDTGRKLGIERMIERFTFPKPKSRNYAADLKYLVQRVPRTRAKVAESLKDRSPELQLRVLGEAAQLEKSVAQAISESPVPEGLTPEQLKQYQDSLAEIAKGFSDQAAEYEKLSVATRKVIEDEIKRQADLSIATPPSDKWPWPSQLKPVEGNPAASLILADLNRDTLLKDENDYALMRAGVLLYSGLPSPVMERYVLEELRAQKRTEIIQKWRDTVK